jgi:hypothetical protein
MFYVWAAFILAGWFVPAWRWVRRQRAGSWPTAEGRIESVEVFMPNFSLTTKRGYFVAELGYSYSVAGNPYSGRYKQDFPAEYEGEEFVRDLRGKAVAVHYNSNHPATSALIESDIEVLQQHRPPVPTFEFHAPNSVPQWIKPFLWFFVCLSAIGLMVSLWVHLGAVMGRRVAPEAFFWMLHVGIFVVWFPAVFVAQALVGDTHRRDFWKVILKGSPDWIRYMVYGFFGYAVANFLFFMTKAPTGGGGANPPAVVWRGFSGHWMAFYSAAFALLYSAARTEDRSLRCANGHLASSNAIFCPQCGQPVLRVR